MNTEIILLTQELREHFKPCIIPDIWQHIEDNDVFGYGILEDDNAVGAVVCSCNNDIVSILSIGVSSEYRRRGFARQLLDHLVQVCSVNGLDEIHARYFMGEQERAPLEALLTSCGYSMMVGEFMQVAFTLGDLEGSRVEKQLQKSQATGAMKKLASLDSLTEQQQQWLLGQVGIMWNDRASLSQTHSCASVRDGQIVGAVLLSEQDGLVQIVQLYSAPGEDVSSMHCLFAAMGELYATLPRDTVVQFQAEDDIVNGLMGKLLDSCKTTIIQEQIAYRSVTVLTTETVDE